MKYMKCKTNMQCNALSSHKPHKYTSLGIGNSSTNAKSKYTTNKIYNKENIQCTRNAKQKCNAMPTNALQYTTFSKIQCLKVRIELRSRLTKCRLQCKDQDRVKKGRFQRCIVRSKVYFSKVRLTLQCKDQDRVKKSVLELYLSKVYFFTSLTEL